MLSLHDSFYEGYVSYGKELGMAEGMIRGTSNSVALIFTKFNMIVEPTMDMLEVPSEMRDEVRQRAEAILAEKV